MNVNRLRSDETFRVTCDLPSSVTHMFKSPSEIFIMHITNSTLLFEFRIELCERLSQHSSFTQAVLHKGETSAQVLREPYKVCHVGSNHSLSFFRPHFPAYDRYIPFLDNYFYLAATFDDDKPFQATNQNLPNNLSPCCAETITFLDYTRTLRASHLFPYPNTQRSALHTNKSFNMGVVKKTPKPAPKPLTSSTPKTTKPKPRVLGSGPSKYVPASSKTRVADAKMGPNNHYSKLQAAFDAKEARKEKRSLRREGKVENATVKDTKKRMAEANMEPMSPKEEGIVRRRARDRFRGINAMYKIDPVTGEMIEGKGVPIPVRVPRQRRDTPWGWDGEWVVKGRLWKVGCGWVHLDETGKNSRELTGLGCAWLVVKYYRLLTRRVPYCSMYVTKLYNTHVARHQEIVKYLVVLVASCTFIVFWPKPHHANSYSRSNHSGLHSVCSWEPNSSWFGSWTSEARRHMELKSKTSLWIFDDSHAMMLAASHSSTSTSSRSSI